MARARTLEGLERYDEALKDAISYAQLDVSLRGTEIVWRLARKVGRPEAALPALKAIVARRPHYTDWQLRQAWVEARHVGLKEAAATVAAAGRRMKADGGALGPVGEACLAAAGRIPDLDVEAAQQVAKLLRVAKDLAAGHAPADRVQAKLAAVAELTRPR